MGDCLLCHCHYDQCVGEVLAERKQFLKRGKRVDDRKENMAHVTPNSMTELVAQNYYYHCLETLSIIFYRTIWKDSTQLLVSNMYYCKSIPQCRCSTKCSASRPPVVYRE